MPRKLFEKDIGELAFAFRYDKSWSQAFALQTQLGRRSKAQQHTKPHWSPKVDPSLLLRGVAFRLLPSGSLVRNSFSDSCNVTVKTGADLRRLRKVRFRSPRSTPPNSEGSLCSPQLLTYTLQIGDGVIDQCDRLES